MRKYLTHLASAFVTMLTLIFASCIGTDVDTIYVTGVSVSPTTLSLNVGQTQTLSATVSPSDASDKTVSWSSSSDSIATVANGLVTAVGPGSATITVATNDGNKRATCSVTVSQPVTGVELDRHTLSLIVGGQDTLVATVLPSNATNKNVTWASGTPSVAQVTQTGHVTALAIGNTTITVTTQDGNKTDSCVVTVGTVATGTGSIAGRVNAPTNTGGVGSPIANATVRLYSGNVAPTASFAIAAETPIATTTTNSQGDYNFNAVPTGEYTIEIEAAGYILETIGVEVEPDVTTYAPNVRVAPSSGANGTVSGDIINAFNGQRITSAMTLAFRRGFDRPGAVAQTVNTSSGSYNVNLSPGWYTITASGSGYINSKAYVFSMGGIAISDQQVTVTPEFTGGQGSLRIVLTWGAQPYDLDSHLVGPAPNNGRFHTWYSDISHYYNGQLYADLDWDDTYMYGPETTTIYRPVDGIYHFYVHDYSNYSSSSSTALRASEAVVRIYNANGQLLRTFNVPTSGGPCTIWYVCTIRFSGGSYTIAPVNTMHFVSTYGDLIGNDAVVR
jgi:uncharacterized protein YjdB